MQKKKANCGKNCMRLRIFFFCTKINLGLNSMICELSEVGVCVPGKGRTCTYQGLDLKQTLHCLLLWSSFQWLYTQRKGYLSFKARVTLKTSPQALKCCCTKRFWDLLSGAGVEASHSSCAQWAPGGS